MTYFARKTVCAHGHTHASRKEARRCDDLHDLQRHGIITGLTIEPVYKFEINGAAVKMGNGQAMRFTPDFAYIENGKSIVEDVKAVNAHMSRDVPVKLALARHLWPDTEWRVVA